MSGRIGECIGGRPSGMAGQPWPRPVIGHVNWSPDFTLGDMRGAMLGNTTSCPKHPQGWAHCYCSGSVEGALICCHCGNALAVAPITMSPPIVHGPHRVEKGR